MSIFTDYASKMRQAKTPFNGGLQQYVQEQTDPRTQSPLYNPEKFYSITPQEQQPVIDTGNALGSLTDLLGPTPAEREAQERRMFDHKNKMQMWYGLFDGLRQLGNLYSTYRGASPMNITSTAPVIDQQYQQQRQFYNDMTNYRRNYAQQLYNLHRQNEADKRAGEKHKAEMGWYDTRSEMAKAKADNDAVKAEAYAEAQKAKANNDQAKAAFYEAKAKALEEGYPYDIALKKAREAQARASANLSNTRAANVGAETETTRRANPDGSTTTNKRTVRSGNSPKAPGGIDTNVLKGFSMRR